MFALINSQFLFVLCWFLNPPAEMFRHFLLFSSHFFTCEGYWLTVATNFSMKFLQEQAADGRLCLQSDDENQQQQVRGQRWQSPSQVMRLTFRAMMTWAASYSLIFDQSFILSASQRSTCSSSCIKWETTHTTSCARLHNKSPARNSK